MHKQHNWKVQGTPPWSEETCYWSERGREVTCGLPEVDPTFKLLLVKEQSVGHNCTSAAIKLKTPTINGCWEKIGQDCQNKNKTNGEKKKNHQMSTKNNNRLRYGISIHIGACFVQPWGGRLLSMRRTDPDAARTPPCIVEGCVLMHQYYHKEYSYWNLQML